MLVHIQKWQVQPYYESQVGAGKIIAAVEEYSMLYVYTEEPAEKAPEFRTVVAYIGAGHQIEDAQLHHLATAVNGTTGPVHIYEKVKV